MNPVGAIWWELARIYRHGRGAWRGVRGCPPVRRRARAWAGAAVAMAVFVAIPAGLAHAVDTPGPGGGANPFLQAFAVQDSRGNPIGAYELSIGGDGFGNVTGTVAKFFAITGWDIYRFWVALALWVFNFAMQFELLEVLNPLADTIARVLQHTIIQLAVVGVLLAIAFLWAVVTIGNGRTGAGLAEMFIALFLASLVSSPLVNPVGLVAGPDGALASSRDLGVAIAHNITTGAATTSSPGSEELQRQTTGVLVDAFVRLPHQLVNYGAPIGADSACGSTYEKVIAEGPYGTKPTAREAMGRCQKGYQEAAESAQSALLSVIGCGFLGFFLAVVAVAFGVGMTALMMLVVYEAGKLVIALAKGIIPGSARGDMLAAAGIIAVGCLTIVGTLIGVGFYILLMRRLFAEDTGWDPVVTFAVLDLCLLVGLALLIRAFASARASGRRMGQRAARAMSPSSRRIPEPARPGALSSTVRAVGGHALQRRVLTKALHGGATLGAGIPGGAGGPDRSSRLASVGGVAAGLGGAALSVAKIGLASTVGAPVYAPRAAAAAKVALAARRQDLTGALDQARAAAHGKAEQARAFGSEYTHNLGAAARFAGRVSRATNLAHAAAGAGAGPLAAGMLAGASLLATTTAGRSPARPATSQHPPTPPHGPAKPSNEAGQRAGGTATQVPDVDRAKLAALTGLQTGGARRAFRPAGPPPPRSLP